LLKVRKSYVPETASRRTGENVIPYRAEHAHPKGMEHGMPYWAYFIVRSTSTCRVWNTG
jgi:hypothetical protein